MQSVRTGASVVATHALKHLFRFPASGTGRSNGGAGGGGSVSRRTMVGLPLLVKVRYSSTGRYGDELNTGCGAAW